MDHLFIGGALVVMQSGW